MRAFVFTYALFLSFLSLLPLSLVLLATPAHATVNRTIDDTSGDSATGVRPVYLPSGVWFPNTDCEDCPYNLDLSQTFDRSWTAATYDPSYQSTSVNFQFQGSAVYIYLIAVNTPSDPTPTLTQCNFTIDGEIVGSYQHNPSSSTAIEYNILAYANTTLDDGDHSFSILTSGLPYETLTIFDYAIYTTSQETNSSAQASSGTQPESNQSGNSSSPIGVVIGGVAGGLAILGLAAFFFIRRRRQRQKMARPIMASSIALDLYGVDKEGQRKDPAVNTPFILNMSAAESQASLPSQTSKPQAAPEPHQAVPDLERQEYLEDPQYQLDPFPPPPAQNQHLSPTSYAPYSRPNLPVRANSAVSSASAYSAASASRSDVSAARAPWAQWRGITRSNTTVSAAASSDVFIPTTLNNAAPATDSNSPTASTASTVIPSASLSVNGALLPPNLPRVRTDSKAELRRMRQMETERLTRQRELEQCMKRIQSEMHALQLEAASAMQEETASTPSIASTSAPAAPGPLAPGARSRAELHGEMLRMRAQMETMQTQIGTLQNQPVWSPTNEDDVYEPPPMYSGPPL